MPLAATAAACPTHIGAKPLSRASLSLPSSRPHEATDAPCHLTAGDIDFECFKGIMTEAKAAELIQNSFKKFKNVLRRPADGKSGSGGVSSASHAVFAGITTPRVAKGGVRAASGNPAKPGAGPQRG